MVHGDKHYKHTDEGPCRSSRRTRSPSTAVLASAGTDVALADDADGKYARCYLFSVLRDGKVSKPEAIFRPPRTQKKTASTQFSVLADAIFCP